MPWPRCAAAAVIGGRFSLLPACWRFSARSVARARPAPGPIRDLRVPPEMEVAPVHRPVRAEAAPPRAQVDPDRMGPPGVAAVGVRRPAPAAPARMAAAL